MAKKKKALMGFSRVTLFPVVENTASRYETGSAMPLEEAMELTKEADVSEASLYADDKLYAKVKAWNGLNVTLTLAEMPLPMMEALGFGTYDKDSGTLRLNPQGMNKEFAMTFRCLMVEGGEYRMFKVFSFVVNEIKESGIRTKNDNVQVCTYQLIGTIVARKFDDMPMEMRDGGTGDMSWLDTVETMDKAGGLSVGGLSAAAPEPKKAKPAKKPDGSALDGIDPLNPLEPNETA